MKPERLVLIRDISEGPHRGEVVDCSYLSDERLLVFHRTGWWEIDARDAKPDQRVPSPR